MNSITRRAALGAAAAWAVAAGSGRAARAGQFTGKIRKAVRYNMFIGADTMSDLDKFQMLKAAGFEGVELITSGNRPLKDPDAIQHAARQTGLIVHGISHGAVTDLDFALETAKFFAADAILVVVRHDPKTSYKSNWDGSQALLRAALPKAERYGVRLLVENVWATFLIEPTAMARYIDELKSPFVQAYFDIGNNMRWGYPPHWIEVLGPRIRRLHVKEVDTRKMMSEGLSRCFDVEIGDGSIDWPGVRRALGEIGYSGWASAEVRGGNTVERFADISRRMDRVLDL